MANTEIIPFNTSDGASQSLTVEIEDLRYNLEFNWNGRAERWTLNVNDEDNEPIVSGIAVVCDYSLLDRYTDVVLPPTHKLIALDKGGTGADPGRDDLGTRVLLVDHEP